MNKHLKIIYILLIILIVWLVFLSSVVQQIDTKDSREHQVNNGPDNTTLQPLVSEGQGFSGASQAPEQEELVIIVEGEVDLSEQSNYQKINEETSRAAAALEKEVEN